MRIVESVSHLLFPLVRDETLDFAIARWTGSKSDPSMAVRPLFECGMVVAGRARHPLSNAGSLAEPSGAEWAVVTPPGGRLQRESMAPRNAKQIPAFAGMTTSGMAQSRSARTDGIAPVSPPTPPYVWPEASHRFSAYGG